jgi:hypothetical protein
VPGVSGARRDPPTQDELSPDLEAVLAFRRRRAKERNAVRDRIARSLSLRDFVREEFVKKNRIRRPPKNVYGI